MKTFKFILAILIFGLIFIPSAQSESPILKPIILNLTSAELQNISILDIADPNETFEWDSPPDCNPTVNTTAWISGDGFECFWTYEENSSDVGNMEIRQGSTSYGNYSAWWDGPNVEGMEKTEVQGL